MSLINQVLQDLEKRHASEPELKSLPPHVRAIPEGPRSGNTTLFVVAALIVFAIIAAFLFFGGWFRHVPGITAASAPPVAEAAVPVSAVVEPKPAVSAPVSVSEPAPEEPTALAAPASRLSEELSYVPRPRVRKEPASTADKPAAPKAPAPLSIPPEFRKATEPPAEVLAAGPQPAVPQSAAPRVPAQPAPVAPVPASPTSSGAIDKQEREITPTQRAELAFRKGVAQIQESRPGAAEASFREALEIDQNHVGARQALLGLLLGAKRNDEAEQLLKRALELNPRQPRHAMVLARLEVERGDVTGAINTMVATLPYVQSDPEYYAFLAALLQREGRHLETVDYYRAALRSAPGNAIWLMGMGISLRATSQFAEARDAFQRALETKQLNSELQAFSERQLRELAAPPKR